jgi:hypothetical protein
MARSASLGVERSTKAYPTGRSVRGFFGIEVDSTRYPLKKVVNSPSVVAYARFPM